MTKKAEEKQVPGTDVSLASIAASLEILASPLDIEPAPPRCPHCGEFNPIITTEDSGGVGPINTYVIRGHCNCGRVIYAISNHWVLHPSVEQAEHHIQAIQEGMTENGSTRRKPE